LEGLKPVVRGPWVSLNTIKHDARSRKSAGLFQSSDLAKLDLPLFLQRIGAWEGWDNVEFRLDVVPFVEPEPCLWLAPQAAMMVISPIAPDPWQCSEVFQE
jgi:hypothetical protein